MSQSKSIANLHHFNHEAMYTNFDMWIVHEESDYAAQASWAAFELLDKLEQELSRHIENSDISQLNALNTAQRLRLTIPAFECLKQSMEVYQQTRGAFDVTVGGLLDCWRHPDKTPRVPADAELREALQKTGMDHIHLSDDFYVSVDLDSLNVDLGGVGKGFGIDQMAELLAEWDINAVLLSSGGSTILAMDAPPGEPGWTISASNPLDRRNLLTELCLCRRALSCSGLEKGDHIIDPRTGRPVRGRIGSWILTANAARADALSTASMIMTPDEIEAFSKSHSDFSAMVALDADEKNQNKISILYFGNWPKTAP